MFEEYKNLWVYIESSNGVAANVGLELLNPTRALADSVNEKLVAIVIDSKDTEALAQTAIKYGADEVIVVEGEGTIKTDDYDKEMHFKAGESFFISAGKRNLIVKGKSTCIITHV